jgi:hypothetical protein
LAAFGSAAYKGVARYIRTHISWDLNRGKAHGLVDAIRRQLGKGEMVGGGDHVAKAANALGWIRNTIGKLEKNPGLSKTERAELVGRLRRLESQIKEALKTKRE